MCAMRAGVLQLQRLALDVRDPENKTIVTGTLILDLEWIPLNAGPVGPPRALRTLTDTRRGSFFVRLLCAWDLPPLDTHSMNCAACVRVTTGGSEERTQVQTHPIMHVDVSGPVYNPLLLLFRFQRWKNVMSHHHTRQLGGYRGFCRVYVGWVQCMHGAREPCRRSSVFFSLFLSIFAY